MGSVIGMANASGASTATIKYDSFGNVTSATGAGAAIGATLGSEPRYHGMQLDAVSGLYHVRARTYDARTGRFTSRDPVDGIVDEPERNHPYAYGQSNPHVWTDPSGRFATISVPMVVIAMAAVLAATAIIITNPFAQIRDEDRTQAPPIPLPRIRETCDSLHP